MTGGIRLLLWWVRVARRVVGVVLLRVVSRVWVGLLRWPAAARSQAGRRSSARFMDTIDVAMVTGGWLAPGRLLQLRCRGVR